MVLYSRQTQQLNQQYKTLYASNTKSSVFIARIKYEIFVFMIKPSFLTIGGIRADTYLNGGLCNLLYIVWFTTDALMTHPMNPFGILDLTNEYNIIIGIICQIYRLKISKNIQKWSYCTFTKFTYCDNVKLSILGGKFVWIM